LNTLSTPTPIERISEGVSSRRNGRPLNAWVLAVGEPLPPDGADERLFRAGLVAKNLAQRGHRVLWWTSAWDHRRKAFRDLPEALTHEGIEYRLLRGCGYMRNISFSRIRDQRQVAAEFARRAPAEDHIPDVMFAAYPTVELPGAAVEFGRRVHRPVVADIRDLWPDIFAGAVPQPFRPLAELAISGLKRQSASVLHGTAGITGVTGAVVDWGLARARRAKGAFDRPFPLALEHAPLAPDELKEATASLAKKGVKASGGHLRMSFAGTLSRQFDFEPMMQAAEALRDLPFEFVIAGTGEQEQALRARAAGLPNVNMVGWLDRTELAALLGSSTLGLAPYISSWDFKLLFPNKISEYMAWGLPVVSSLEGEVAKVLEKEGVGVTFAGGDGAALIRELRLFADDRSRIEAMSARGRALYTARFSAEQTYVAMASYLEEVAADRIRANG